MNGLRPFSIAAAQVASIRGDIERNIATHVATIASAAGYGVAMLVFPELSLTGYEPDLAAELAITAADGRLEPLRAAAWRHGMNVAVGAPLDNGAAKPALGAILFDANGATRTYRKMHLGSNEQAFFTAGDAPLALPVGGHTVGIAICADSSQPTHPAAYAELGADVYAVGVFLNAEWYATDVARHAEYAARHRMLTLMANHGASVGSLVSVGKSAIWAPGGALLVQAEGTENVLLIAVSDGEIWRGEAAPL